MKIKYGNEKENIINGVVNYGFNIRLKNDLDNNNFLDKEEEL
jgi:hypothetical protein